MPVSLIIQYQQATWSYEHMRLNERAKKRDMFVWDGNKVMNELEGGGLSTYFPWDLHCPS